MKALGADEFYTNPVLLGDHPDPSIIRVGNDFWATSTSSEWGPQFLLQHSTDLVNWEIAGVVFPHRPAWAVGNFWAPEISEYKGRYQVYYVGRKRGGPLSVAVAVADEPGGPYTDMGPLVAQDDGSIDPAPATDENGNRYLIWKEDGNSRNAPTPIWAQPLNEDGTKLIGQPTELIRNDEAWEGGVVEGPFILRRGDWFYLFYSGNGCCGTHCHYALGVARSHKLLGPWQKDPANPILAANTAWECPGHGSVVMDQRGRYWFLYHAYSVAGSIFTGREGMLDEVKFGADDWPMINDGTGPSVRTISPFGIAQQTNRSVFMDDFSENKLRLGWQWPQDREPSYRLEKDHLLLHNNSGDTNLLAAVLARPVTGADYVATTLVENRDLKPGSMAGLWAYGDSKNSMGLVVSENKIFAWRQDKGTWHQLASPQTISQSRIYLRLVTHHGFDFQLSTSEDGKTWKNIAGTSDTKDLPPWDRSVRVALTAGGATNAVGEFESFSLVPLAASN
ncbi:MAG TPA: family 43 glycosylhydrolase [Verrucomicrobiae bacterium]|nr:family 43 glycosylhydrolase [Verrucomicrobiae bacterium]